MRYELALAAIAMVLELAPPTASADALPPPQPLLPPGSGHVVVGGLSFDCRSEDQRHFSARLAGCVGPVEEL